MMNAEQRSLLKIFDITTRETAITDILAKMPYIKYPELSYQTQMLLEKLLKMSDTEFNLLKKRISRV